MHSQEFSGAARGNEKMRKSKLNSAFFIKFRFSTLKKYLCTVSYKNCKMTAAAAGGGGKRTSSEKERNENQRQPNEKREKFLSALIPLVRFDTFTKPSTHFAAGASKRRYLHIVLWVCPLHASLTTTRRAVVWHQRRCPLMYQVGK